MDTEGHYFFPYNIGERITRFIDDHAKVAQVEEPRTRNAKGAVSTMALGSISALELEKFSKEIPDLISKKDGGTLWQRHVGLQERQARMSR